MTAPTPTRDPEHQRFDWAIEQLLNSRHLNEPVVRAVFAYADGDITREQFEEEM